jgi:exodeoxyribonuclease-3
MDRYLSQGFVDTFRALHPDEESRYSWWMYMRNARERNIGWRIDYFLVSEALLPAVSGADILSEVMGSDHCPVTLELDMDRAPGMAPATA